VAIIRKNNVPWDLPCKVFLSDWRLLRIKTTVNFYLLRSSNTARLGVIPDSVILLLPRWNCIYCCYGR
jgi:hypothetical protein